MSNADELKAWLDEEIKPSIRSLEPPKKRERLVGYDSRNNMTLVWDCMDAAKSATGSAQNTFTIYGDEREKAWMVKYTVSDVEFVRLCDPEHDFTEWAYDFMGGDIRHCKRCGLYEYN